jgi:hypothetical protein
MLQTPPPVYAPAAPPVALQRQITPGVRAQFSHPRVAAPPRALPPQTRSRVAQPYFVIPPNRVLESKDRIHKKTKMPVAIIRGENSFPSQIAVEGSFLKDGKPDKVNAVLNSNVSVRVSDNGEMAIQDSTLVHNQPKAFYASATVIAASRSGLQGVNSNIELQQTSDKQMRVLLSPTDEHTLHRVVPKNGKNSFWDFTAPQNCQNMASNVTGRSSDQQMVVRSGIPAARDLSPTLGYQLKATVVDEIHKAIAEIVADRMGTKTSDASLFGTATETAMQWNDNGVGQRNAVNQIAKEYVEALGNMTPTEARRELGALGINQYAIASVGEAYVTHSIAVEDNKGKIKDFATRRSFVPKWSYHFAGVVARSGNDTVTLENYARGGEGIGNVGSDPRWYFQMYGSGTGQSFHEASVQTGGFANPITMVVSPPPPPVPVVVAAPGFFAPIPGVLASISESFWKRLGY